MVSLADTLIQGVLLGGLYALFAAGLSLIFGVMRLVNLAHGDLIVLAAFLILTLVTALGLNAFVATLIAAPIMFAIGFALQAQVLNRTLGPDILPPLLVTFGLSIVIQNGLLEAFSADSRRISVGWLETASLALGPINVGVMPLLTFASALAVIVGLNQLFYRTSLGRAFRATSDDKVTASLMGIRPDRIFATATGIAMVVAAIAALFLGARANFDPTIGPARLIYASSPEAVIIGGPDRCGHSLPAASSSGSRRPSAPRSIPSGRFFSAMSLSLPCFSSSRAGSFRAQPIRRAFVEATPAGWWVEDPDKSSAIFALVAIATILVALAAPLFASRGALQDLFFIRDDVGAGAELEPARRLRRPGIGRPAGVCRLWRLCDVRLCPLAGSIRFLPFSSPA